MIAPETLVTVLEATWPCASSWVQGPFRLRDGAGGGKRVSATTREAEFTAADLDAVEQAMGDQALYMIRPGGVDHDLDAALAARNYRIIDPVLAYAAPVSTFAPPAEMTTFPHWPPLQITADLWDATGTSPARRAVMARATGPKAVVLARANGRAAGVAYVALHGQTAMLHALEVLPEHRRQGSAQNILRAAAHWAAAQGADTLSLVVTTANTAARSLYVRLGMVETGSYHYRQQ